MGIADIFFEIAVSIVGGDLLIPAFILLIAFIGLMIFGRFPQAAGIVIFGIFGVAFYLYAPIHEVFTTIYFFALVGVGIVLALFVWNLFSKGGFG